MTDLTLNEYENYSDKEREEILNEERKKMFSSTTMKNIPESRLHCFYAPCLQKIKRTG